jgi:hypothetical protein
VLGIDIDQEHILMNARINSALSISNSSIQIPFELTYCLVSLLSGLIAFSIVKFQISFGYYYFVINKAIETTDEAESYSSLKYKVVASFLGPLLICLLFVNDLVYGFISELITLQSWWIVRLVPICVFAGIKAWLIRDEVQF